MNKFANARKVVSFALLIAFTSLIAFALLDGVPLLIRTSAQNDLGATDSHSRKSKSADLENYDIRLDGGGAARAAMENYRLAAGRESSFAAAEREKFVAAENRLRQRVPSLVVEYNETLHAPEVIGLDVNTAANGERLAVRSGEKTPNHETLRQFIYDNNHLIGLNEAQIGELKTVADYTNPDGVLSYAHLEQTINGVPVFQAEIKAGFNKRGEMFRVINNLAPALDYNSQSGNFGDARAAVGNAFKFVSREMTAEDAQFNQAESTDLKSIFGAGDRATTAEKMYFPTEAGAARPAWRVLIWGGAASYYVIVDAETATLLWRKNITAHQTQPATYNVYANSTSMIQSLDSPAPLTPGSVDPTLGTQAALKNRTFVTLIGNEGANSFNNLGWITDGSNTTDGNNVQAGLDRDGVDGVDAAVTGSGTRVFNFNYTPGNPTGGDDPLNADSQKGAVTQLFYLSNRYHDEMYKLGFTEAARNFQNDNFGRGGNGGDRVSAEAQDSIGTNNANFGTPADGGRGRMQMYLWTAPNPDRDGDLDADIVIHELTHGLSNRLIGNAVGLNDLMSRGMGEGWSDFYAHCLLSEPSDPIHGIYTTGGYSTQGLRSVAGGNGNYYHGIRAFPKAVKSFKGGALSRPHNPLTFADIDSTQLNVGDGAFAPAFTPVTNSVHFLGEVWSSALWEVRARLIRRLGHAEGNRRILQFVTDGMKLTPNSPTFLQARDAIKQAAMAGGTGDDLLDVRIGFAICGMGDAAQITSESPVRVVESYLPVATPAVEISNNPITIVSESVAPPNNAPDPNETLTVNVPLQNYGDLNSGANVTVSLLASGGITNPSAAQNYGTLSAGGAEVSRNFTFDVPAGAAGGSQIALTFQVQDTGSSFTFTQTYTIAAPSIFNNGINIVSESILPANNTPDPGETVTVNLALLNIGNAASGSITATLQNSGGITPIAPMTQNYGVLAAGATATQNFSFQVPANAVCGSSITLTFQVQDAATSYNFTKTYTLGTATLSNSENFDGVTAPALPVGWTSTQSGIGTGWTTSTTTPSNAPNAAFAGNPDNVGLSDLESPAWNVTSSAARLDFKINYDTEAGFDGAVLEMKIGSGAYQDIIAAGGSLAGGYNATLDTRFGNPLPGRSAWSGNSGGYVSSSVNLPAAANGQTVQFRWRMGSDAGVGGVGVRLDDVQLFGASFCPVPPRNLVVTKTADTNDGTCDAADCSLREALDAADSDNLGDTITFNIPANSAGCNGTNCTIILTSSLVPAADAGILTTIDGGAGANRITLSGGAQFNHILSINNGTNINVNNLNFTRGTSNFNGGSITVSGGALTLSNSALYGNESNNPGGALRCESGCTANLTNVTISGNSSPNGGGISNAGTVTATNCTITDNSGGFGGGGISNNGTFNIRNTIIAGNNSVFSAQSDVFGVFASQGYNLIGITDGTNGFTQTGDQTGTPAAPLDARLAPLGTYGGKTLTHALLDGGAIPSPAINTGTATGALSTDQRGAIRVGVVDKGAFEVNNTPNSGTFVAVLPTGRQTFSYQTQIAANNGAFTYSVTSGALPNGVSLTTNLSPTAVISLSGTPTESGTFNFAITATNGNNSTVTNYRLQVFAPTAASVSVSGRVFVNDRGLRNAFVTLTDQNGETRTARTSSFGYYRFDDVEVGQTYIVSVRSKRFQFAPQIVNVNEELSELNFYSNGESLR